MKIDLDKLPARITEPTTAYDLLQRVKRIVLEEPARIDMNTWSTSFKPGQEDFILRPLPVCGTIGCIGGWTELLVNPPYRSVWQPADQILGLDAHQANELFYHLIDFKEDAGTLEHAQEVAYRIDKFCARYKDQLVATEIMPLGVSNE